MTATPATKTAILFFALLGMIAVPFALAVWHHNGHETRAERVQFQLTNHRGETVTQTDLGGRHLLVFFGFTQCQDVCPTQMTKLTRTMAELDRTGHGNRIRPVFISVDPERDTPQTIARYLAHFDERFIGLTGSRSALKKAADSFKTLLEAKTAHTTDDYQVTHSSITYIVDPFSRIVDYLPGQADARAVADRVREVLR